jgi:hypothetical protein
MPTRNVNLTDELDGFVLAKVESGRYEMPARLSAQRSEPWNARNAGMRQSLRRCAVRSMQATAAGSSREARSTASAGPSSFPTRLPGVSPMCGGPTHRAKSASPWLYSVYPALPSPT